MHILDNLSVGGGASPGESLGLALFTSRAAHASGRGIIVQCAHAEAVAGRARHPVALLSEQCGADVDARDFLPGGIGVRPGEQHLLHAVVRAGAPAQCESRMGYGLCLPFPFRLELLQPRQQSRSALFGDVGGDTHSGHADGERMGRLVQLRRRQPLDQRVRDILQRDEKPHLGDVRHPRGQRGGAADAQALAL